VSCCPSGLAESPLLLIGLALLLFAAEVTFEADFSRAGMIRTMAAHPRAKPAVLSSEEFASHFDGRTITPSCPRCLKGQAVGGRCDGLEEGKSGVLRLFDTGFCC
jgi:hypothetical protein